LGVEVPQELQDILVTIRLVESGNRYDVPPNRGNASGAYQYIASTWNNYRGYPHAYLAPPWVQDERALADVKAILWNWGGDVSMVPVIWYYPKASRETELMDIVPIPSAGNRLTVREYQFRWLDMLEFITGAPLGFRLSLLPPDLRFLSGIPPELPYRAGPLSEIGFAVLGRAVVAPPTPCIAECESGAPAIVYGQKLQPVLAVADGVVTALELGDAVSGEVSLTMTDRAGHTYHYAGFNDDAPGTDDGSAHPSLRFTVLGQVGTAVRAGQILGYLGDTDPMPSDEHRGTGTDPVWPHLRLTIRDRDGTRLDADLLLTAAQRRLACHVGIGPWSVPPDPRLDDVDDDIRDDVEVSAILDGRFTLHSDGTVTAYGKSALIVAPEDCQWAPEEPFGPGASGNRPPDGWTDPFEIPSRYWVAGTFAGSQFVPAGLLRRR
jgi:hypothetical protein